MMSTRIIRTGLAALVVAASLVATPGTAQLGTRAGQESGTSTADRLEAAVASLREHQDTSGVVGLSAALAVDGRLRWAGGFGWADLQARIPMGPETVSRIGSISKPVAAAATMVLVDRGALDLDAPVSRYLPDYPRPQADRITTRQLMSHTAGIRHYRGDEFLSNVAYDDVFAPMEVFWADSLLFEPGSEYNYSTYGWTVVSAVTAAAADRPFVDVLRDEVIRPLGLLALQPEWQDSVIPNHARFYTRDGDGAYLNAPEVDQSNKWAGGGIVSTASDLVNFALGLLQDDLLSDDALAESWTRQTPEGEPSYGLGWRVADVEGHRVVSHSGGSVGATAMLVVFPDDGVVVSLLGNTGGVSHGGAAVRAARILLGLDTPGETATEDA
ncbi:MAG TPA: serine hydrolase domain-containing protein [Longimicrobiales bacterium]|nr:serine hydrolase domain-containing protein [Longimicrobiales bacterium]